MYAEDTKRIVTYLNTRRSGVDRQVLARVRADNARGKATSAIVRLALAEHYGIEKRPALGATEQQLGALAARVEALSAQVEALSALAGPVDALRQQNEALRLALLAAVYGDRSARAAAAQTAAAVLASNGSGHE